MLTRLTLALLLAVAGPAPAQQTDLPGARITVDPALGTRTPPGYRAAWDDGRLNLDRGKQTLEGALQTALIWTQTSPRQLKAPGESRRYGYTVFPTDRYRTPVTALRGGQRITVIVDGQRRIVSRSALRVTPDGRLVVR